MENFSRHYLAQTCNEETCHFFTNESDQKNCLKCGLALKTFYDFYAIFTLSPLSQFDRYFLAALKKNYKKLSLTTHPDVNTSRHAADTFSLLQEAFHVLQDQLKKQTYDDQLRSYHTQLQRGEVFPPHLENDSSDSTSPHSLKPLHPSVSSKKKLFVKTNLSLGLILGIIAFFSTFYYGHNLLYSFISLIFFLSLAVTWNQFYQLIVTLLEVAGFLLIGILIYQEHLTVVLFLVIWMFLYFLKIKKKLSTN